MNTAVRKRIQFNTLVAVLVAIVAGITIAIALQARAATVTVAPGSGTLQAAIDAASDGDTLTLSAGDYVGDVFFNSGKSLSFIGVTGTVIKPGVDPVAPALSYPNFTAANAASIALKNITFDGTGRSATAQQTGLDLNSIANITLENITAKNYLKNGISITASYDAGPGGNFSATAVTSATLTNVTTDSTAWAGIALFEAGVGPYRDLSGIVFAGTTSVSNSTHGIQLGKGSASSSTAVSGVAGAPINLGNVVFANNTSSISGGTTVPAYIATTSTVDGQPITAALIGSNVTIGVPPVAVEPTVPGVPNTAAARR